MWMQVDPFVSIAQIGGCADGREFVKILQPSSAYAYHEVLGTQYPSITSSVKPPSPVRLGLVIPGLF